jgi:two-component system CheB/CheR fusion protein
MVVGLGASAGGLKALGEFFQNLPAATGMAYVVVVHLSPEHESSMRHLLQQSTRMPVAQVTESVRIEPNHVYVISPNSQLTMRDGSLEPAPGVKHRGSRMTIDVFLETLGEAHKHRAVGIILSGTGSDGTLGARSLKASGGIVLAQAPEDAEYDAMPRSAIATGAVDFVMPAREMPHKISSLWQNARSIQLPALPEQVSPEDAAAQAEDAMRDILAAVRARTRHDFSQYKRATLLRRIERRMQVNQLRTLSEYREFIGEHPNEAHGLLRDLLISVTWFFRDPQAWKALAQRVIPDVIARRNSDNIRIWCVGCATGEEVYTLAMLFQEALDDIADAPKVNIFATDIDDEALAFARAGLYPDSISEQVTPERVRRFFVRE